VKNTILFSILVIFISALKGCENVLSTKDDNIILYVSVLMCLFIFLLLLIYSKKIRLLVKHETKSLIFLSLAIIFVTTNGLYFLNKSYGNIIIKKTKIVKKRVTLSAKKPYVKSYYLSLSDTIFNKKKVKKNEYKLINEGDTIFIQIREGILGFPIILKYSKDSISLTQQQ